MASPRKGLGATVALAAALVVTSSGAVETWEETVARTGLRLDCSAAAPDAGAEDVVAIGRYAVSVSGLQTGTLSSDRLTTPLDYRLGVAASPCRYRWRSHRYLGIGTAIDTSAPLPPPVEIDGAPYAPLASPDRFASPVRGLHAACERDLYAVYPWTDPGFDPCSARVDRLLWCETTRLSIVPGPDAEPVELWFVLGEPWLDGRRIPADLLLRP